MGDGHSKALDPPEEVDNRYPFRLNVVHEIQTYHGKAKIGSDNFFRRRPL